MKLSIITINLNNKEGLLKTIESVIHQTFTDYEFIIIDGKSTDGSVDVIEQYKDKITYWVSEPDTGIFNAMNKGVRLARGEYQYFLNTGDRLVSNDVLEKMFEGDPHDSFICGNVIEEHRDGSFKKDDSYKYRDWGTQLYEMYGNHHVCHQAFFIKSDNFTKYGEYDESLSVTGDWKFFFVALGINREPVLYKDIGLVIYNMEGISSWIGGTVISKEKRKVFQDTLSENLINRYDRLYELESNAYIIDFVLSKKWIYYWFHAFRKIVRKLGLAK